MCHLLEVPTGVKEVILASYAASSLRCTYLASILSKSDPSAKGIPVSVSRQVEMSVEDAEEPCLFGVSGTARSRPANKSRA